MNTTLSHHRNAHPAELGLGERLLHQLEKSVAQVFAWSQRHRERQSLLRLDDHLLHDIGMTRGDVYQETDKPFWRN